MADKKITQLPSASVATANNVLPIVQSGVTDQITVTNLGTGILNLGLAVTASTVAASSNGAGTNFKVGDDVWIGDVNLANTMQVQGQQDATKAFVKFGSGSNSPIVGGVAGSDLFQITGSVNASGTITAASFTGSLLGTASLALAISASTSAQNLAHFIPFLNSTTGTQALYTDTGIQYNPGANLLSTTASLAVTSSYVNPLTQNVLVTGSVNISSALNLAPTNPLPTGVVGSLAVSGSNLYFHNGTDWLYLI